MTPVTEHAQDDQESAPPESAAPFVLPTIEELAANPPPRKFCIIPAAPPDAECLRAVDAEIGSAADSLRRVFIAAKLWNEKDAEGRLTFTYLFQGHEWPVSVRLAVLASCPLAVHLERRLAAIEHRLAAERNGPPPPILDVR